MWYLKNIPKQANFYWGSEFLPWVRYLTLRTFRYQNPDWGMVLWTNEVPTPAARPTKENWFRTEDPREEAGSNKEYWVPLDWKDNWWKYVEALNVTVQPINVETSLGIDLSYLRSSMRDMASSDFLRWFLFSDCGGLWADMDILFFKSIDRILVNFPKNEDTETVLLQKPYNNLLLSAPGSPFFKACLETALKLVPSQFIEYAGVAGPPTYEKTGNIGKCITMPKQTTEVFPSTREAFDQVVERVDLPMECIGVHWHGSGLTGTYMSISPDNYREQVTVIGRLVQYAMKAMGEK
jgi:hypothetical protein